MKRQSKLERFDGKGRGGRHRWRVVATSNGKRISGATEGYVHASDRDHSIDLTLYALIEDLPEARREKLVAYIRSLS